MGDPLDQLFDEAHKQVADSTYVPRMNRRWEEREGRIVSVSAPPSSGPGAEPDATQQGDTDAK
jgi:ERCC4-related helicase